MALTAFLNLVAGVTLLIVSCYLLREFWLRALPVRLLAYLAAPGIALHELSHALGCVLTGTALAGYTGLVLTSTNRPLWGDTAWMSLLFLLSGISAGSAAMILFGRRRGHPGTLRWLEEMERYSTIGEIIVLAIMAITLGSIAQVVWGGVWAVIMMVGVVLLGLLVPLFLYLRPRTLGAATIPIAAVLVLLGVFLLRTVVILSSEAI